MQPGEVWWAQFDEQHPVVLLSEDSPERADRHESGVRAVQLVAASGVNVDGLGLEVAVGNLDGLPSDAVVRVAFPRPGFLPCTWVTTVGAGDLLECLGTISAAKLAEIDAALALGDRMVSADDADHEAAESTLAAIRQSLRQGTMATRQISRPRG